MGVQCVALPRHAVNIQKSPLKSMDCCAEPLWEFAVYLGADLGAALVLTLFLDKLWFYVRILYDINVILQKDT